MYKPNYYNVFSKLVISDISADLVFAVNTVPSGLYVAVHALRLIIAQSNLEVFTHCLLCRHAL